MKNLLLALSLTALVGCNPVAQTPTPVTIDNVPFGTAASAGAPAAQVTTVVATQPPALVNKVDASNRAIWSASSTAGVVAPAQPVQAPAPNALGGGGPGDAASNPPATQAPAVVTPAQAPAGGLPMVTVSTQSQPASAQAPALTTAPEMSKNAGSLGGGNAPAVAPAAPIVQSAAFTAGPSSVAAPAPAANAQSTNGYNIGAARQ